MQENPKKISITVIFVLVYMAVCADLIQFFLTEVVILGQIISTIISLMIGFGFFLFFKILGVKISIMKDPKRMLGAVAGPIIEAIPVLQALPGWTVAIILTIISVNYGAKIPLSSTQQKPPSAKSVIPIKKPA